MATILTIKPAGGGDYTTITAAIAALSAVSQVNWNAAGGYVLECYEGNLVVEGVADSFKVDLTTPTPTATAPLVIRAAPSAWHDGKATISPATPQGAYVYPNKGTNLDAIRCVNVLEPYTIVEGLRIVTNGYESPLYSAPTASASGIKFLRNCIEYYTTADTSHRFCVDCRCVTSGAAVVEIEASNNIIYGDDTADDYLYGFFAECQPNHAVNNFTCILNVIWRNNSIRRHAKIADVGGWAFDVYAIAVRAAQTAIINLIAENNAAIVLTGSCYHKRVGGGDGHGTETNNIFARNNAGNDGTAESEWGDTSPVAMTEQDWTSATDLTPVRGGALDGAGAASSLQVDAVGTRLRNPPSIGALEPVDVTTAAILADTGTTLPGAIPGYAQTGAQAALDAPIPADPTADSPYKRLNILIDEAYGLYPIQEAIAGVNGSLSETGLNVVNLGTDLAAVANDLTSVKSTVQDEETGVEEIALKVIAIDTLTKADGDGDLAATKTAVVTTLPATLAGIDNKTTNLPASPAAVGSAMILTSAYDVYWATVDYVTDNANGRDEYTVQWFKNGAPVTSGITVPALQVVSRSTGSDLIASGTVLTQVGSTGAYYYNSTSAQRLSKNDSGIVVVSATIDAATRTWRALVTRGNV